MRAVEICWGDLRTGLADLWDGAEVEISGWVAPFEVAEHHGYFLLVAQPTCCIGCLPSNPSACVEVFAAEPIRPAARPVRLAGRWRRLVDDPAGWRYQLRDARLIDADPAMPMPMSRREVLSAGALATVAACALPGGDADTTRNAERNAATRQLLTGTLSIDQGAVLTVGSSAGTIS